MKIVNDRDTLRVSAVKELGAANSTAFRKWVRDGLAAGCQHNIEIDLSETQLVDSCGLGALLALQKTATARGGRLRLCNPQPPVQQVLDLTQLGQIFEIVNGRAVV